MRNILILAALLFATTAYAAPPTDHDGSGTETFTLDYSTMVTELNDSTARYRITDGTTVGDWTSWTVTNGDATDAMLDMPETTEDVTIELEVTDLAGNTNDYTTDALVIPYGGSPTYAYDGWSGSGTSGYSSTQIDTAPQYETARTNRTDAMRIASTNSAGTLDAVRIYIGATGMTGNWFGSVWTDDSGGTQPLAKICQTEVQAGGSEGWTDWLPCTQSGTESMSFSSGATIWYSASVASGYIGGDYQNPTTQRYFPGAGETYPDDSETWTSFTGANRAIQVRYTTD